MQLHAAVVLKIGCTKSEFPRGWKWKLLGLDQQQQTSSAGYFFRLSLSLSLLYYGGLLLLRGPKSSYFGFLYVWRLPNLKLKLTQLESEMKKKTIRFIEQDWDNCLILLYYGIIFEFRPSRDPQGTFFSHQTSEVEFFFEDQMQCKQKIFLLSLRNSWEDISICFRFPWRRLRGNRITFSLPI